MKWSLAKNYRLPSQNAENLTEQDVKQLREVINAYTKHNRELLVNLKKNEPEYGVSPVVRGLRRRYKDSKISQEKIDVGQTLGTKYLGKEATKSQLLNEYYYQRGLARNQYLSSKAWKKTSTEFRKTLEEQLGINENLEKGEEPVHFTSNEASELYGIFDRLKESGLLTSEYYEQNRLNIAKQYIEQKRNNEFDKNTFEREIAEKLREDYEQNHILGQGISLSKKFTYNH